MEPIDLKSGKFKDVLFRNLSKEERQSKAFEKLQSLYEQYPIKPKKFGFTEASLKDAQPYDSPNGLKNWASDKRKTTIPSYAKINTESGV